MSTATHRWFASSLAVGILLIMALEASAAAPLGRYTVTADTVYDTQTNLTWQRAAPSMMYDQAGAASYCMTLSLSGAGWRLPTVKELQSLVDVRVVLGSAFIDPAFTGPMGKYWSSTNQAGFAGQIWTVDFQDGTSGWSAANVAVPRVRCVR